MPVQSASTLSDSPALDHLLFLPPNVLTAQRLRGELAAAGLFADTSRKGLRIPIADFDWAWPAKCERAPTTAAVSGR